MTVLMTVSIAIAIQCIRFCHLLILVKIKTSLRCCLTFYDRWCSIAVVVLGIGNEVKQ